jgi:predicted nuclease of predicted toxin-antitoxin system
MRFLADAGISPKTVEFLRRNGHDAVHVREIATQRAADRLLVESAGCRSNELRAMRRIPKAMLIPE